MRILLIEDEAELAATIRGALEKEGYVVDAAEDLASAGAAIDAASHDLVLLDRTLPDGDGLTMIGPARSASPGVPVLVLTARNELLERVEGLDEGADDYLAKPFALEELFARIRAIRRRPSGLQSEVVQVGRLSFDIVNDEARVADTRLDLPRRQLLVLNALVRRRGRTVLRETLEQAVYGFDDEFQSNTLDSHISRLRRNLREADAAVDIHTIRGVGYLLQASA